MKHKSSGADSHLLTRLLHQALDVSFRPFLQPTPPARECQKVWGNQAAHASVAGVLPGPRFWGDIVDA